MREEREGEREEGGRERRGREEREGEREEGGRERRGREEREGEREEGGRERRGREEREGEREEGGRERRGRAQQGTCIVLGEKGDCKELQCVCVCVLEDDGGTYWITHVLEDDGGTYWITHAFWTMSFDQPVSLDVQWQLKHNRRETTGVWMEMATITPSPLNW